MTDNSKQPSGGSLHSSETRNRSEFEAVENTDRFDDNDTDSDWMSETSISAESDSKDCPLDMRLAQPTEYFQELDNLGSRLLGNSMFQFHKEGKIYQPFDGHFHLKAGHGGNASLRSLDEDEIKRFYQSVLKVATEAVSQTVSAGEHYTAKVALDRAIENMFHLIECRNIILWIVESVEAMEAASYCGTSISVLVIDQPDRPVARLLPIQSTKIKKLATAFENCLSLLISLDPSTVLVDTEMTLGYEISEICRDLLSGLGLNFSVKSCADIWQCTVHVLDMAVLSYAGAHTQFLGESELKFITLPGPFLEKQYFMLRRRSFLCLDQFLGGQQAWVLEWYRPDIPQLNLPPLYLSTDATTFSDIWGPMWKTCASINGKADHDHILQYSVGNGIILPWRLPPLDSQNAIAAQKDEIFCHWISDRDISESDSLLGSSREPLCPDSILLIGAVVKLHYNSNCNLSVSETKQRLRDDGALSELGTMKTTRIIDSNTFQTQIGAPYVKIGAQRTYKMRGRTWKEALVENWKNNSETRNVRILEYKLGVEVSSCTFNTRRRRLITLLGSTTILNYLRNGSLSWTSDECEAKFYAALESPDHKAFRKLYQSHKNWQFDLGKAITHCLDILMETGTKENGIDILWIPDSEQGRKVHIRFREHNWARFLKDTEDCCTMAVLEDKCLELPNSSDLIQVRKCRNPKVEKVEANPDTAVVSTRIHEMSVLETSFILNENFVPRQMRREPCHGHNGSTPRFTHRWSISSIEPKEKFSFGEKGKLKFIKSLGNGRILASWRPAWDPFEILKEKFGGNSHDKQHKENIRDESEIGGTGPIYVVIISSEPEMMNAASTALRTPPSLRLGANSPSVHRYSWVSSSRVRPRNTELSTNSEMAQIMGRWMRGELATVNAPEWEGFREAIATLIESIPLRTDNDHGELERKTK